MSIATLINDRHLQGDLQGGGIKIAERHDWGVIASKAIEHYLKLL